MSRSGLACVLFAASGCNLAFDFDDIEDLPCGAPDAGEGRCDPGFVCFEETQRCVPRSSVDSFKSCPSGQDDLCPPNHRCTAVNGQGRRCLPRCPVVPYARRTAGAKVAESCPAGTLCWEIGDGDNGVCSEGVCQDNQDCPGGQACVIFNGGGRCFEECDLFRDDRCGGDEVCHPIGIAAVTACVRAGQLEQGNVCTRPEDGMCRKSTGGPSARPLICARPAPGTDLELRCEPACDATNLIGCIGTETCVLVRADIDPLTGLDLGLCQ